MPGERSTNLDALVWAPEALSQLERTPLEPWFIRQFASPHTCQIKQPKYGPTSRDVLAASLDIQLIALAAPFVIEFVIDTFAVHRTTSTRVVVAVALSVVTLITAFISLARQLPRDHQDRLLVASLGRGVHQTPRLPHVGDTRGRIGRYLAARYSRTGAKPHDLSAGESRKEFVG